MPPREVRVANVPGDEAMADRYSINRRTLLGGILSASVLRPGRAWADNFAFAINMTLEPISKLLTGLDQL
jgi:hypothetical protein